MYSYNFENTIIFTVIHFFANLLFTHKRISTFHYKKLIENLKKENFKISKVIKFLNKKMQLDFLVIQKVLIFENQKVTEKLSFIKYLAISILLSFPLINSDPS